MDVKLNLDFFKLSFVYNKMVAVSVMKFSILVTVGLSIRNAFYIMVVKRIV